MAEVEDRNEDQVVINNGIAPEIDASCATDKQIYDFFDVPEEKRVELIGEPSVEPKGENVFDSRVLNDEEFARVAGISNGINLRPLVDRIHNLAELFKEKAIIL